MNPIIQEDLQKIKSSPIVDWGRFRGSTVLISGANGMLPSYMVEALLYLNESHGYEIKIIALVRIH